MACLKTLVPDEDLRSAHNKYDDLLSSFASICKFLELKANNRKKLVDLENEMTFAKSSRAIATLSNYVGNISLACEKIRATNLCLSRQNFLQKDECIELPYDMQSETVQCLKEVYNALAEYDNDSETRLLPEANCEAASALIKTVESNICEIENFQLLQSIIG